MLFSHVMLVIQCFFFLESLPTLLCKLVALNYILFHSNSNKHRFFFSNCGDFNNTKYKTFKKVFIRAQFAHIATFSYSK